MIQPQGNYTTILFNTQKEINQKQERQEINNIILPPPHTSTEHYPQCESNK